MPPEPDVREGRFDEACVEIREPRHPADSKGQWSESWRFRCDCGLESALCRLCGRVSKNEGLGPPGRPPAEDIAKRAEGRRT